MSGKRTTHRPKYRQGWIFDYLVEAGDIGHNAMFAIYSDKFSLSDRTFAKDWIIASDRYKEYVLRLQKKKEDAQVKEEVKFAVRSLRSKHERLLEYQKLVDDCFNDLATGMTNDMVYEGGKQVDGRRRMTITEVNQTRRTLRELQIEISKIEGDYAPEKRESDLNIKGTKIIFTDGVRK